jgi:hypothetical protein
LGETKVYNQSPADSQTELHISTTKSEIESDCQEDERHELTAEEISVATPSRSVRTTKDIPAAWFSSSLVVSAVITVLVSNSDAAFHQVQ